MSSSELDQKPFILPSEMQQKMLAESKFVRKLFNNPMFVFISSM